jgi:hypothetical protein
MNSRIKLLTFAFVGAIALMLGISSCDAFLPTGTVSGTVLSFTTADGIEGVTVTVSGHTSFSTTTDADGNFSFDVPSGDQTLILTKTGYDFSDIDVTVTVGETTAIDENEIYGQPVLASGQYRIVLTWGASPSDLDSHLITPNSEEVYFGDKTTTAGDANLDVDDTSSYGPETVTITSPLVGTYRYFVYNWSGSPSITVSSAVVRVYSSAGLVKTYNVPTTGTGGYWNVFTLSGGNITDINTIVSTKPAGSLAANLVTKK